MFSGTVRARDRLGFRGEEEEKVTAIGVSEGGSAVQSECIAAGQIGKLWGLANVRIGDTIGTPRTAREGHHFAAPTLGAVVVPRRPTDKGALYAALARLADQDP